MGTAIFNAVGWPWDGLASHPGRNRNTLRYINQQKADISTILMGHLACRQTLPIAYTTQSPALPRQRACWPSQCSWPDWPISTWVETNKCLRWAEEYLSICPLSNFVSSTCVCNDFLIISCCCWFLADFQRRERVLEDLAQFKGALVVLFFCHRDWLQSSGNVLECSGFRYKGKYKGKWFLRMSRHPKMDVYLKVAKTAGESTQHFQHFWIWHILFHILFPCFYISFSCSIISNVVGNDSFFLNTTVGSAIFYFKTYTTSDSWRLSQNRMRLACNLKEWPNITGSTY